jgi:hypothetical protein
MNAGDKVTILQDCRESPVPAGTVATYDGKFPLSVALTEDGGESWIRECDYAEFVASPKLVKLFPLWDGEEHGKRFAMVMRNPRMTLPDGSKIWGCECWWEPIEQTKSLDSSQKELEELKSVMRDIIKMETKT